MNDDLISRQAAIGAIYTSAGTATAIKELKQLPSADVVEVVRCKDCKYSRKHKMFDLEYFQCERTDLQEYFVIDPDDFCSNGEKVTE